MSTLIQFTKMHGLGNDFVVLDRIKQYCRLTPELIRKLADRNYGIGCDQLLVIDPPTKPDLDFSYRIFNPDGQEVEQCGNGARCIARYLFDNRLTDKNEIALDTIGDGLSINISDINNIQVDMGSPVFTPKDIPLNLKAIKPIQTGRYKIQLLSEPREATVLSLGNPHCIFSVPGLNEIDVNGIGEACQTHPAFPKGINVIFTQVLARNHIKCRIYERGAKETLACGSGACAAVIAGTLNGELNEEVKVDLPGGSLTVSWEKRKQVLLTGPTTCVFTGQFRVSQEEIF